MPIRPPRSLLCTVLAAALGLLLAAKPGPGRAQALEAPEEFTRILFVFDASGSMFSEWQGEYKIDIAKRILVQLADSLSQVPNLDIALRIYGHQYPAGQKNCRDTKLEVPFIATEPAREIRETLQGIRPKGITPIARSLERAASDFPSRPLGKNVIILITDGKEECNGDPCAVAEALLQKGVRLKPFVIGLNMNNFAEAYDCMGRYYNVRDPNTFKTIMQKVVTQAVNKTTAQVNLLDGRGRPTETDVAMTFYEHQTGRVRYRLMHTLNAAGQPDTFELDLASDYDLVVHTLPPVRKKNIHLKGGQHNVIELDAPQGKLSIQVNGDAFFQCVVRRKNKSRIVDAQPVNSEQKYIVGLYDVEILSLPPIVKRDVLISQGQTQTIQVPEPGELTINKRGAMVASLYREESNGQDRWVTRLKQGELQERFAILPGNYVIVYRRAGADQTESTQTHSFMMPAGGSKSIYLK